MSSMQLEGVGLQRMPASKVPDLLYKQLFHVEEAAFSAALPQGVRSHLMYYLGTTLTYANTRRDPRLLIASGRVNPDQSYSKPEVTVAFDGDRTIGYAYCADNVSGKGQFLKQFSTAHNYRWLRVVAVHPEYWGRGVAHGLVNEAFSDVNPERPATAYTWPKVLPKMSGLLNRWGFEQTADPPQPVNPFYMEDSIDQYRFKAEHVSIIQQNIGRILADNV